MTTAEGGADEVSPSSTVPQTNPENRVVRPPVPSARRGLVPVPKKARMPSGFASVRDILSFIAGVAIIANEVFFQDVVEIAVLTVGVALAGLPVVFGADEKRKPPPTESP